MSSLLLKDAVRLMVVAILCLSPVFFSAQTGAQDYPAEFRPDEMVEFSLDEAVIAQIDGHYLRLLPEYIFPNNWELILDLRLLGHFMFDGHAIFDG